MKSSIFQNSNENVVRISALKSLTLFFMYLGYYVFSALANFWLSQWHLLKMCSVWYIFVIFIFSGKISMILVWQNSLRPTVIIFLHILIRAILPWLLQQTLTTFTTMFITELFPMLEHLHLRQVQVNELDPWIVKCKSFALEKSVP